MTKKKDRTTIVLVGLASTPKADKRPRGTHTQKNRKNKHSRHYFS
jgi:hypothetical protein